ncbi:hypothetical protein OAT00_01250 [Pelagibacteraceae bacterium]|nr:hypothetical protein [Flavobacteriales bacterium]MDC1148283.1 hypothetical protein [Pelagibacteraceae bacterium]
MKKQLTITTNTEELGRLRFQNNCLSNFLNNTDIKSNEVCECLKYLNHSVSKITNLFKKEIDEFEDFMIDESRDFNRINKTGRKLNLLN